MQIFHQRTFGAVNRLNILELDFQLFRLPVQTDGFGARGAGQFQDVPKQLAVKRFCDGKYAEILDTRRYLLLYFSLDN